MSDFMNQIKEEPSVEFILFLPAQEVEEETTNEKCSVIVKRFDERLRSAVAFFSTFYVCEKCFRPFREKREMSRHRCTSLKLFCDLCGQSSKNLSNLKTHMIKKHTKRESYKCNDCGESFLLATSLINHRITKRRFQCVACDINFICQILYKKHLASHEGSFKCNQCSYIGSTKKNLCYHKFRHNKFSCETCSMEFSTKSSFDHHQITSQHGPFVAGPKFSVNCGICQKSFTTPFHLKRHIRNSHGELKYQCDYCGRAFKVKNNLFIHVQRHIPMEKCPICDRYFIKIYMNRHIKSKHISKYTFQCTYCPKIFKHKESLKRHSLDIHAISKCEFGPSKHKKPTFKCKICSKVYKYKHDRKHHILNVHTISKCENSSQLKKTNESNNFEKPNIKVEPDDEIVKREPAEEFVLILPPQGSEEAEGNEEPKKESLKECSVNLTRFNRRWKTSVKVFDTVHVCRKCNRIFSQKSYLISHSCINIKFHCDLCKYSGKLLRRLKMHMNVKHLNRVSFTCNNCGGGFSDAGSLNTHVNSKKEYKCISGDATFKCILLYKEHLASHEGAFKCNQCSYIGSTVNKLYNHKLRHKSFCETCERNFVSKRALDHHQMTHQHGSYADKPKLSFNCEICQKPFSTPFRLKCHIQTMHGKFKYQCDYCAKYFRVRKIFSTHLINHVLKEKCPICQKFYTNAYMKIHIKIIHEFQPLLQCNICFKKLKQKCSMERHMKYAHSK